MTTSDDLSPAKRALLEKWKRGGLAQRSAGQTIPRRAAHGPDPLSFAQQRLWFLDQVAPGSPAYNMLEALFFQQALDHAALRRSLDEIVRRHESLRTTFVAVDGQPAQIIAPSRAQALPLIDLRGLGEQAQMAISGRIFTSEAQRPFDLARGPLLRTMLLRMSERDYALLVVMHHIITDGWSMDVFYRELAALYEAFAAGKPSPLPDLPIQYADYAVWQRQWLKTETIQKQLAYWRARMGDNPPALELPSDRPRPPIQSFRGGVHAWVMPQPLAQSLGALSRQEGSTLFMTLMAAFQALLYRHARQPAILVGTPIAGRTHVETEGLIGLFVNTLALRSDMSDELTFRALLGQVREAALGAFAHQDLPFELLVEELQPERDTSRSPLFQVMFALQNTPTRVRATEEAAMKLAGAHSKTAKFDLWLSIGEGAHGMDAVLEYSSDLFDEATIARMAGRFQALLGGIVADPGRRLADLPLLTEDERRLILHDWQATRVDYPGDRTITQMIERQAARTPDAVAIVFEMPWLGEGWGEGYALPPTLSPYSDQGCATHLTYGELDRRANQLAQRLRRLGAGPESRVGVYAERSAELVVALLGILKAGAAYVPFDPSYRSDRLAFMLEDSCARLVVTNDESAYSSFVARHSSLVDLVAERPVIARLPAAPPPRADDPDSLAYVIYTSGSTGRPKGVMNTHRGIRNRLLWMQAEYGLDATDCVLQKTPFSFDVSVWEFFWPLIAGARLAVARPEGHKDPRYLAALIDEQRVTTVHFVPSMLGLFLDEPGIERCDRLRRVICSGEALPFEFQQRFFERMGADLHNLYGPTEAAIDVTAWACERTDARRSVPIGVPGEIHIGGIQLARGYLARPDLTAERFIPDAFGTMNDEDRTMRSPDSSFIVHRSSFGARLYKTGDLARWRPDGAIEYLGRLDDQIKLRGVRIELGEIEATLRGHPSVQDALVVVRGERAPGDGRVEQRLAAYVVPEASRWHAAAQIGGAASSDDQVGEWRTVFDETYAKPAPIDDPAFNIAGWNSSYTDQPIPPEEMREWVEQTVAQILDLRPRRALEIGCGVGLLLFRIAPECDEYRATDFSHAAAQYLGQQIGRPDWPLPQVSFSRRTADDFSGVAPGSFDVVILNSVVQYFPSVEYLVRVLEGGVRVTRPGGAVFVGDVRSLPLLETFCASVELYRAPDDLPAEQIRRRARARMAQENELVLDPAFFFALQRHIPAISRVELRIKRGRALNELTKFRYDVLLHVGPDERRGEDPAWIDWAEEKPDAAAIDELLQATGPDTLAIAGAPNARLARDLRARDLLQNAASHATAAELREALRASDASQSIEPSELRQIGERRAYAVWVGMGGADAGGSFDVVFHRNPAPPPASRAAPADERPWESYANDPLRDKRTRALIAELRGHLRERLPDYMTPAAFVVLDALPLTPSGKADRQALPDPPPALPDMEHGFVAPRTPIERTLAEIWAQVLGVERIGVNNNFFEIGGDSIRSIQVVARAGQAGIVITPRQMFRHQTIAELAEAAVVKPAEVALHPAEGAPPPTPFQHWLFERNPANPGAEGRAALLDLPQGDSIALIEQVIERLIARHDALRLRFEHGEAGWKQISVANNAPRRLGRVDLSALKDERHMEAIEALLDDVGAGRDTPALDPLRVALVDQGARRRALLVAVPGATADADSWRLLMDDLRAIYERIRAGSRLALPHAGASFAQWAERVGALARTEDLRGEIERWLAAPRRRARPLPQAGPPGHVEDDAAAGRVVVTLDGAATEALLRRAGAAYRAQPDDLLLAALVMAFAEWTGAPELLVDLQRSGRGALPGDKQMERVVGCFSVLYPALLCVETDAGPGDAIKAVKEQLRQDAQGGIGYGVLRYLADDAQTRAQLRDLPQAEVRYRFIETADRAEFDQGPLRLLAERADVPGDGRGEHGYALEVGASVVAGDLCVAWAYDAARYGRALVERLAAAHVEALRRLIAHCASPDAGGYTPSDFPLARMDQAALDRALGGERMIEDVYPLTPMQRHMVLSRLRRPVAGLYVVHQVFLLHDPQLDVAAFEQAWREVIARHPILRTSFVWEGLDEPLQVVHARAPIAVEQHDWSGLSMDEQTARMHAYLDALRRRGFDLGHAPHTRLALFRRGSEGYLFVWAFDYTLQDGWSFPLILGDFFALYEAISHKRRAELDARRPFRDHIALLQQQDRASAEAYWRRTLKGFAGATPLVRREDWVAGMGAGMDVAMNTVPLTTTAALQAFARRHQITLNTLAQCAWSLVLSRYSGRKDVIFGAIVSGRPATLAGVESMVGLFNNLLPVRALIEPERALLPWLRDLQSRQVELREYEYSSITDIKEWCGLPEDTLLFQSYLVFENFPIASSFQEQAKDAGMRNINTLAQTEHPLRVEIVPGSSLWLIMSYYRSCFEPEFVAELLDRFCATLAALPSRADQPLGALLGL